jgi:hypothetical protein
VVPPRVAAFALLFLPMALWYAVLYWILPTVLGVAMEAGGPGWLEPAARTIYLALLALAAATVVGGVSGAAARWAAGQPCGLLHLLRVGARRAPAVAGTALLVALAVSAGTALLVVPGLAALSATMVAVPAAASEGLGPRAAVARSLALTRGSRWELVSSALALAAVTAASDLGLRHLSQLVTVRWLDDLLSAPFIVGLLLLWLVLPAVAYHDLRVAREGVDTSRLSQVFE